MLKNTAYLENEVSTVLSCSHQDKRQTHQGGVNSPFSTSIHAASSIKTGPRVTVIICSSLLHDIVTVTISEEQRIKFHFLV